MILHSCLTIWVGSNPNSALSIMASILACHAPEHLDKVSYKDTVTTRVLIDLIDLK